MPDLFDNAATVWIVALALGLPIAGAIAWACRSRAKTSVAWRMVICVAFACAIAPYVMVDDEGPKVRIDTLPAGALAQFALHSALRGEFVDCFQLLGIGSLCVIITTVILAGIWFEAILVKRFIDDVRKDAAVKQ